MNLPEFNQEALDRRFIAEVHRLHEAGAFTSFREFTTTMGVLESILPQIEKGRYHCNHKLIYSMARHYSDTDVTWLLLGSAATGRPEPTTLPTRQRGRPLARGATSK